MFKQGLLPVIMSVEILKGPATPKYCAQFVNMNNAVVHEEATSQLSIGIKGHAMNLHVV